MSKFRHWKQRWDPKADLVFLKRLRIGDDPEKPYVLPGEPVTPEIRAKLGVVRLRRWWDSRVVGLANWQESASKHIVQVKKKIGRPRKNPDDPKWRD